MLPGFLLIISLMASLGAASFVHSAPTTEPRRDQIEKIETDLNREREQFLKFNDREKELLEQLSNLEKEIAGKRQNLAALGETLARNRVDLQRLKLDLTATEKSLKSVEDRLARRLVAFYKYSKRGHIQVLSRSKNLEDLGKRIKYLGLIMSADRQLFEETSDLRQKRVKEERSIREKLDSIEQAEKEENDRLLAVKEDLDNKVLVLMKIHKEREFYETAVKELEVAARGLKEKLLSLEKAEITARDLPSDFASWKGRLPLPCVGRVLKPSALGLEDGLKGIFILASNGAEAKAVFPGRVEFSGRLRGYGEIIVINHGSRYYTVTAYLERRKEEEGKLVKAGDVVGLLGKETAGGGRLYFEIRKGGVNLDPSEWLKVH